MNKEELIDLVKLNLAGGDASAEMKSRYSPQEIEKYCEMVFDDLVYQSYLDGDKTGDMSQVDNYQLPYFFPVLFDSRRRRHYIVLDPQPTPLPNNFGIRQICPPEDESNPFTPIDNVSSAVWAILEADSVSSVVGYMVEGNRVVFDYKFPKNLEEVMVKQIITFSALKDTDSVFIPGGNNTMIFEKVRALMLNKPQPDTQGSNQNVKQV